MRMIVQFILDNQAELEIEIAKLFENTEINLTHQH